MTWDELDYWKSEEWSNVEKKLAELAKTTQINPVRDPLFSVLDRTPYDQVRVFIIGQDPYPDPKFACGVAFDVPVGVGMPASLRNIIKEYCSDLHYPWPMPTSGYWLIPWSEQGVLLWNAIPTCEAWKAGSHRDWTEYHALTREIVERLSAERVVFVFVGAFARQFRQYVDESWSTVIEVGHPSPLNRHSRSKFEGCRMFSRVNAALVDILKEPIDWRL